MKKLLLIFSICCFGWQYNAFAECVKHELNMWAITDSNEYLYQNSSEHNVQITFECGGDYCDSGTLIFMPSGHYFNGISIDKNKVYICRESGDTRWSEYLATNFSPCNNDVCARITNAMQVDNLYLIDMESGTSGISTGSGQAMPLQTETNLCTCKQIGQPAQPVDNTINVCKTTLGDLSINASRNGVTKDVCNANMANVSDDHGTEFTMTCNANLTLTCEATKCEDGYTLNPSTGKCTKNNNNGGGGGGTGPNQCEQRRCAKLSGDVRNKCIACCHVSSDVAKWNSNTNTCICTQNASYLFVPNSNPKTGGFCIPQQGGTPTPTPEPEPDPEPAYICDPAKIAQIIGWQTQYASSTTISAQIMEIIQYCENDPNENTFNVMYSQLVALINQENAAAQLTQQQNASRRRIEGAISDIDSVVSTLDRSKWKNAEGGFNTSRLLSDSIAGVVLGTAGGLITSHVVKKNQVKGGFEDIQCTVGGQVVAGWGDEFQVGIQ